VATRKTRWSSDALRPAPEHLVNLGMNYGNNRSYTN